MDPDGVPEQALHGDELCPRCANRVEMRFYGPCDTCRDALRSRFAARARQVDAPAFEPKVHVTANAVALKE